LAHLTLYGSRIETPKTNISRLSLTTSLLRLKINGLRNELANGMKEKTEIKEIKQVLNKNYYEKY
jgi:hypothetical protein